MGNCQCRGISSSNNVALTNQQGFCSQIQIFIDNLRQNNKKSIQNIKQYQLNDKLYRGILSNGKKTGYGQLYGKNMAFFGQFKNDLPNGYGLLVKNFKDYIKGDFIQGKPHGQVNEKINKSQFHGNYTHGQKAKGILKTEEYIYEGSFKNNKFDGYGILQFKNGDKYDGNFFNGFYHGDGKYETKQQGTYIGEFKNGQYDGKGAFKWRNGYFYEGYYSKGVRNGFGKFTKGKDEHEGQWINGQINSNQQFLVPKENNLLKVA